MTAIEQPPIRDDEQEPQIVPPTEPVANIRYRRRLREWAVKTPANRDWLMKKCKEDFFFWLESFALLFEPRPEPGRSPILPFIPWVHQRPAMKAIINNIIPPTDPKLMDDWSQHDVGIEKARGEGATWMCLYVIIWAWIFYPMQAFGIVSRNEDTADNPGDPDSLGAKIDWALSKLPLWMVGIKIVGNKLNAFKGGSYRRNISKHTWVKDDNGSSITAYPSTGDLGSGGRKSLFFMDELSKFPRGDDEKALTATEPVTNCRLLVSTYNGADGAYYRAMTEDSPMMIKLKLKWTDNPYRSVNKFIIDGITQQLLDPITHKCLTTLPTGYSDRFFSELYPVLLKRGYCVASSAKLIKKVWSPWYVDRCLRPRMTPQKIAQEYDMDPIGSGNSFFPSNLIDDLLDKTKLPLFVGDIEYDLEKLKIIRIFKNITGSFKIWLPVGRGSNWRPPLGNYVIGCDVAQGLGTNFASNSSICVLNRDTGQKIAEFASPTTLPETLAEISIALAHFFVTANRGPAFLIWEANGPGGGFRERVLSSSFRNIYYRTAYTTRKGRPSKEPGWWSSVRAKMDLLTKYRWALQEGYFSNPSNISLREAGQYVTCSGGRLEFVSSSSDETDPSDAGESHGDRCIADAVANFGMEYLGGGATQIEQKEKDKKKPLDGSFLARRISHFAQQKRKQPSW